MHCWGIGQTRRIGDAILPWSRHVTASTLEHIDGQLSYWGLGCDALASTRNDVRAKAPATRNRTRDHLISA